MPVKIYLCSVCGKKIPRDRIAALKLLGRPEIDWTHVACSTEKKKLGIFMGEVGTSEMKIVDHIYEDTVRSIFKKAKCDSKDNEDEDNIDKDE